MRRVHLIGRVLMPSASTIPVSSDLGDSDPWGRPSVDVDLLRKTAVSATGRDSEHVIISPTAPSGSERATENTVVGERLLGDVGLDHVRIDVDWCDDWWKVADNAAHHATLDPSQPALPVVAANDSTWRNDA